MNFRWWTTTGFWFCMIFSSRFSQMGGTKVWSTVGCWMAPANDYLWRHSTAPPWTPWSPPQPTSLMKLTLVSTNQPCSLITWPLFTSAGWMAKTMLTEGEMTAVKMTAKKDGREKNSSLHSVVGDETISQRRSNDVSNSVKSSLYVWIQVKVLK